MKTEGIRYKKSRQRLYSYFRFSTTQMKIAANLDPNQLERKFNEIAQKWVGVFDLFHGQLSWSVFQAELATDIVFQKRSFLTPTL